MKVMIGREHLEPIHIERGVRQGCCLSPTIFNAYLKEVITESMDGTKGITVGGKGFECIRFADDMLLLAENEKALQEMLENLSKGLLSHGMKINKKKTKVMAIGTSPKRINIKIENCDIEQVSSFRYFGSLLQEDGRYSKEIRTRIAMAKEAFNNA